MLDILKKVGLVTLVVLIYFFGIRELRQELHDLYMGTLLPTEYGEINEHYLFYSQSSVSFSFDSIQNAMSEGWQFRMPFDSYWLFGTIVLVLIGASKMEYVILSVVHLTTGIFTGLLVAIGLSGNDIFLITTDFICRYLIPLVSLGYVAILTGKEKFRSSSYVQSS